MQAIDQMKPTISRAMATLTTLAVLPRARKAGDLSEISCEGHNDGKEGDIVWRDGSNQLFPTG